MSFPTKIYNYSALLRLNKPAGIFLLLWPTLMALWIAAKGFPGYLLTFIFVCGVFVTRAGGCIINDLADRKLDRHVSRTQHRPLASGSVSIFEALLLAGGLFFLALVLVLQLNYFSLGIAIIALLLTALYPFAKRFTHLPQLILAVTFNLGILMAFAAVQNKIPAQAWLLYLTICIWTVAYDTQYAMADKEDDLKIGIKSTAILFGAKNREIINFLQLCIVLMLVTLGVLLESKIYFYFSILAVIGFFIYQNQLLKTKTPGNYFKAFLNNQWPLLTLFIGIFVNYLI